MNDNDVPNDDMPNFLRPAPRDGLPFSDAALAALLAGTEPPEPTPGLEHVADLLAALRSAPASDELAGEAGILAEFRRGTGGPALSPGSRRPRRFTSRLGARAAVAAAVAALGLGGLATAAYAGMLPAPVQRLAHDTIGAPAVPSGSPSRSHQTGKRTPAGPGAAGLTARRWCTAYAHGTAVQRAAARHDLIRAAGGAGKIAEYCGTADTPWPVRAALGRQAGPARPAGQRNPARPAGEKHTAGPAEEEQRSPARPAEGDQRGFARPPARA